MQAYVLITPFQINFAFFSGIFFVLPCIDDVRVVNLRTVTFDVPPQEVNLARTHAHTHLLTEAEVKKGVILPCYFIM